MIRIQIYFDGSCKNVKNSIEEKTGLGIAVLINGEYSEVYSKSLSGPPGTNNIAEWASCCEGFKIAEEIIENCKLESISYILEMNTDSQIVQKQYSGEYNITKPYLKKYYEFAKKLGEKLNVQEIHWVKGHNGNIGNELADRLASEGRRQVLD